MLKRLAVFPFLFVLYVILSLLLNNIDQIDPGQARRPLIVLLFIAILAMVLLRALLKDVHYAGWLVFTFLAFFFIFSHLGRVLDDLLPELPVWARVSILLVWGLFLVLISRKAFWSRLGGAALVTPLANLTLAIALSSQLITHAVNIHKNWPRLFPQTPIRTQVADSPLPKLEPSRDDLPLTGAPASMDCTSSSRLPDIYYIILDGYGRSDVLETLYGVDNTDFLDFLESQGFYIARESHTNFIQTALSLPASLNYNYIPPEPEEMSGAIYFSQLIAENNLFQSLKRCGYRTVVFKTGFYFTNHIDADIILSDGSKLSEFESLLLSGTPADLLAGSLYTRPPEQSYQAHRRRVRYDFEQLQQLPSMPGPKVVFAHIVSPHPPFVFDSRGRALVPARSYSLEDGDEFGGDWNEYRKGYAGQVQYVDRMLERTIGRILERSSMPPVIVIQGDHGPGGSLDWGDIGKSCLWERTSILNAYYLPGEGKQDLYPSISPVNTFRVVLNTYFDAGLEMLPDLTFYTSHRFPRQVTDITEQRESTENCPIHE